MIIPSLYDEYDRGAKALSGEIDFPDLARTFEFSQISKDFNKGYRMKFLKVAYAIQMPNAYVQKTAEEEKGDKLTKEESGDLKERIKFAWIWLSEYAPKDFKFEVKKALPKINLSETQKKVVVELAGVFGNKKSWKGEDLHKAIYEIKERLRADPKEVFGAIYQIFLEKESGPQVGWLLASLDYDFVLKRLDEATKLS